MGNHMRLIGYVSAIVLLLLIGNMVFQVCAQSGSVNTFTIPGTTSLGNACGFWWAQFNATGGDKMNFQWTVNSQNPPVKVDAYITKPSAVNGKWLYDVGPDWLQWGSGVSGSMTWTVASTGAYALIIVNSAPNTVSGTMSMLDSNTTVVFSATGQGTVTFDLGR